VIPIPIVESEIGCKSPLQCTEILVTLQINVFVLYRSPEPFDMHVVPPPPSAIHADPDSMVLKYLREAVRGELTPLVGVEDGGCSISFQSFFQCFFTEPTVHAVGNPPGKYLAAIEVHDRHKVDIPDSRKLDIRQVSDPHLVGIAYHDMLQQVGIHRVLRMLHAGHSLGMQGFQMHMMHDPPYLFLRKSFVSGLQCQEDFPVAIERPLRMDAQNPCRMACLHDMRSRF